MVKKEMTHFLESIRFQTVAIRRDGETTLFRAFFFPDALCDNGVELKPYAEFSRLPAALKPYVLGENTLLTPEGGVAETPYEWLLSHGMVEEFSINEINIGPEALNSEYVL
jgi:hypothetical protein